MATAKSNNKKPAAKPAKKSVKKVTKKQAPRTTVTAAPASPNAIPPAEPLRVADEMFSITESSHTIPAGKSQIVVNGTDKGLADVRGRKLEEFVVEMAQRYGVRNFTVYVDGAKVTKAAAGAALDDAARPVGKIEIIAKDSRA